MCLLIWKLENMEATYTIQITEQDLPVLSAVANKALSLIQDNSATNGQIETLIKQDPALTQRVLHVANSPFYAGRVESRTITAAIARLGLRQLRSVIITAATGELFNAEDKLAQALWEHSIASGIAGQILSQELKLAGTEEAFIASILHDVGKAIIYRQVPQVYGEMIQQSLAEGGQRLHQSEESTFKYFNHCTVGALTIRKWRLSDTIAEAVRFHHELESASAPVNNQALASIVSLANIFANNMGHGRPVCEWQAIANMASAQHLRLSSDRIAQLAEKVRAALEAQWPTMN